MNPLNINILLHYHTAQVDYAAYQFDHGEREHATSPSVGETLEFFVKSGLLKSKFGDVPWTVQQAVNDRTDGPLFEITEKGRAMVEHLCAVQVPIPVWVQPAPPGASK